MARETAAAEHRAQNQFKKGENSELFQNLPKENIIKKVNFEHYFVLFVAMKNVIGKALSIHDLQQLCALIPLTRMKKSGTALVIR